MVLIKLSLFRELMYVVLAKVANVSLAHHPQHAGVVVEQVFKL